MKKIIITFGTRPEAIKMAPVYFALKREKKFCVKMVLTGQHTTMLDEALRAFRIKPEYNLNIMIARQTLSDITTRALKKLDAVYKKEKPDLVLVHGDTTTTLSACLCAFYNQIPVAHVEAGLRTHHKNEPFPEELNRILTDSICDILYAPTQIAKENLLKENVNGEIFVTGNTVIDAIKLILERGLKVNPVRCLLSNGVNREISNLTRKPFVLFTMHRRESWGKPMERIFSTLYEIFKKEKEIYLVYPVHPNPKVKIPAQKILSKLKNVILTKPISYTELLFLMQKALFIATDSGGIQEEATFFGKKVLLLRRFTERPEGVKAGFIDIIGLDEKKFAKKFNKLLEMRRESVKIKKRCPYGDGRASLRILSHIKKYFGLKTELKEFGG
ncbi:MAG: UDP-N-acetylglucosamine 2-epimerase (non-hydrolyzing) [Elusimicrobia bacterium]|nr:UDP-N-acetylglucosamine 2-epimerase (non-hydrolyzing) [Elusimicrobiota bacterium]